MSLQPRIPSRRRAELFSGASRHQRLNGGLSKGVDASELVHRQWPVAPGRMDAGGLEEARVLLLGFPPVHLSSLRDSLRSLGVHVTAAAPSVMQLPDVAEMGLAFNHVLVHFDAFDDVEAGVEALIAFRASAPETIVVVCSALVSGDDLGSERALICDATLRLPVSTPRMREGLFAARNNHAEL